jgi:hypothetical protein
MEEGRCRSGVDMAHGGGAGVRGMTGRGGAEEGRRQRGEHG